MLTLRMLFLSVSLAFGNCEQIPRQGGICYHCEHFFPRRGIFNPKCLLKKASVTMFCGDTSVYCISISHQGSTAGDFYGRAVKCTTRGTKSSCVWSQELCPVIQVQTRQTGLLVQKCIAFCIGQGCRSLEYPQERRTPLWKWRQMWLMDLLSKELASSYKQEVGKAPRRSGRSANIDNVSRLSQEVPVSVTIDPSALFNWTEHADKQIFRSSDGIAEPSTFSQQKGRMAYGVSFIPVISSSHSLILHTSHGSMYHVANSEMAVGGLFEDTETQPGPISVGQHPDFTLSVHLPTTHVFQVVESVAPTDLEEPTKSTNLPSLTCTMGSPGSSSVGAAGYQHIAASLPDEIHLSPSFNQQNAVTPCVKALWEFDSSQTAGHSQRGYVSVPMVSNHVPNLIRTAPLRVPTDVLPSSAFDLMECSVRTDSLIRGSLSPVKEISVPSLSLSVKTFSDITPVTQSGSMMTLQSQTAGMLHLLDMWLESESMPHSLTQSEWSSDTLQTGSDLSGTVQATSSAPSQSTLESDSLLVIEPTVDISLHPDDHETELLSHIARDSLMSPSFYRGTSLLSMAKMTKWHSISSLAQLSTVNPKHAFQLDNVFFLNSRISTKTAAPSILAERVSPFNHSPNSILSSTDERVVSVLCTTLPVGWHVGRHLRSTGKIWTGVLPGSRLEVAALEVSVTPELSVLSTAPSLDSAGKPHAIRSLTQGSSLPVRISSTPRPRVTTTSVYGIDASDDSVNSFNLDRWLSDQPESMQGSEFFGSNPNGNFGAYSESSGSFSEQNADVSPHLKVDPHSEDLLGGFVATQITAIATFLSPDLMHLESSMESSAASVLGMLATSFYSKTNLPGDYPESSTFAPVSDVSSETIQSLPQPTPLLNISASSSFGETTDMKSDEDVTASITQPSENVLQTEIHSEIVPGYIWDDAAHQRVASESANTLSLGTPAAVVQSSFLFVTDGLSSVSTSSPGTLSQESGCYANSACALPEFGTILPSTDKMNSAMQPSLVLGTGRGTSWALERGLLFNSTPLSAVQKEGTKSSKVSLDLEYSEANTLIQSTSPHDVKANQLFAILRGTKVVLPPLDSSTKLSPWGIVNRDLPTPLSIGYSSLYAMKSFFRSIHTLDAKELLRLPVESMTFSLSGDPGHSIAQYPVVAELGNSFSIFNTSSLKLYPSTMRLTAKTAPPSLNIIRSVLPPSFMEDRRIAFKSSSISFWETPPSFTLDGAGRKKRLLTSDVVPLSISGSLTWSTDVVDVITFPGVSLELKVTVPSLHVVSTIVHPLFDSNENTTMHLDLEPFSADGSASSVRPTETLDLAKTHVTSLKPKMFPMEISSLIHPTSISAPETGTEPLPQSHTAFSGLDVTVYLTRLSSFQSVEELSTALESRSMLASLGAGTPTLQLSDLTQGAESPTQFLHSLSFGDPAGSYDISIEGTGTVMKTALPVSGDLYTAGSSELDYFPLGVPSSTSYHSYAMGLGGFEKATSKLESIFDSGKLAAPTVYLPSHCGDATLPIVSIQSDLVFPSKDVSQLALISSVLFYPHRELQCLEPQCILSTMQHSHLGLNKFSLVSQSLSSSVDRTDVLHLDDGEVTKVLAEDSEEAASCMSLSSIATNAGGYSHTARGSEGTFPLADLHEVLTRVVLNNGWVFTSIEGIPRTSLDVTGSVDLSTSISDSPLQPTSCLEAWNTAIINRHGLAVVSNTLMETEEIPSSLVESNSLMQSPSYVKANANSSEYFTLGEETTSCFSDVSNSVKDSIHPLTPEVFIISVSSSRTFSPMPTMTVSFNDMRSLSYGNINADSFILATSPKPYPESLRLSEANILKATSQQPELDSLPLHTEITSAPVLVTIPSSMLTCISENMFLSVTDTPWSLASGSSVPISSSAADMASPFPISPPSEGKTTIPASVASEPKLVELLTEFPMHLGDSAVGFSRVLQENPPSTMFLSAATSLVDTMVSLPEAVILTPSPESFLYVESSIPITIVPTLTEPGLMPISSLGAESVVVGSKSTQISEETSAFSNSTLLLPSSQILNQSMASLIGFPSLAPSALAPSEGGSCANPSTPGDLSKVTPTVSAEPSFVPRTTLQSSSTPLLTLNIEPSLQGKTSSARLKTMSSSADGEPPSASREALKPILQLTDRPMNAASQNPMVPGPSPHPMSSSGGNRTELALIKEENLLAVALQVNGSVPISDDPFWQSVSEGLRETYLQALRFTGESDKARRRGETSEDIQVTIESVSRQNSDDVVVQFVVLSNGRLLKATDVTGTFERLPRLADVLSENLPYQVVRAPCAVSAPLPQPPTHSRAAWMVGISVLGSFCLALLLLLIYCKKKGWRGGEDISVSQQGTFRRERAEAPSGIQLQERKQRVSDVEKGLPEGKSAPKPLLPRLPELEASEQSLSARMLGFS